jgi:hypothetical protein
MALNTVSYVFFTWGLLRATSLGSATMLPGRRQRDGRGTPDLSDAMVGRSTGSAGHSLFTHLARYILTFYVPMLVVGHAMAVQLLTRASNVPWRRSRPAPDRGPHARSAPHAAAIVGQREDDE